MAQTLTEQTFWRENERDKKFFNIPDNFILVYTVKSRLRGHARDCH